jgi:hypothetical protein
MPVYHLHADVITKGKTAGGAAGFRAYISREAHDQASMLRRYIDPAHGREDLVASGQASLPRWAKDAEHFWQMADRYERHGWVVARTLEIALPRELSPEGRLELTQDICEVTVGKFAHSWAIHEPQARDGSGIQPHVHIMFSPRREDVELDRTPAQWFAKAAARDQDPLRGGVRKDVYVERKGWLYDVREAVALLSNAALHREGIEAAVDHRTLEAQGLSRDPARYNVHDKADVARTMEYRQQLNEAGVGAYEGLIRYAGWQDQALQLFSLDRQYIKDLTRDHVWRYDRSPARQQEREQSLERTFSQALRFTEPEKQRTPTRTPARARTVAHHLRGVARAPEREDRAAAGAALNVRLHDRDHEQDRGIGW